MEDNLPIGLRFSLLHRAFRRKMDALLSEKELTGVQFGVLMSLVRMEKEGLEEISQRALEERTRVTHATMTEILKRLEKKGFLRSEQSVRDRRYKSIHAADKAFERAAGGGPAGLHRPHAAERMGGQAKRRRGRL